MINIGNPYNSNILMKESEYNRNYKGENNKNLRRCNWSKEDIRNFMKTFDLHCNEELFKESLFNIEDYGLHYKEISDINSTQNPQKFHEIGINNFFGGKIQNNPLTFEELIECLKKNNNGQKNNSISDDILKSLKESYYSIKTQTENLSNIISEISNEKEKLEYIKNWAKKAKENKSITINEIIAYINQLFKIIFKFYLKPSQIISILVLSQKKKNLGRIAQILTGEGKTAIIITLAALNVIKGHKVDIVTSSEVLAKRDAENEQNKMLYNSLDISVAHCIKDDKKNNEHGPKACYKADIVYGDTHNFQADILNDKYMLENTRNGRKFDMIIVDEIDSVTVDYCGKSTLLAGEKPYMDRLNYILIAMWTLFIATIDNQTNEIVQNTIKEIKEHLAKKGREILNDLKLPKYLKDYAENEMEKLADSAVQAYFMKENIEYRVIKVKIEPIDNK